MEQPDAPDEEPPRPWHDRPETLRYKLVEWLGIKTRGRIPRPFARTALAYHLPSDAEENQKHTPPEDEKAHVLGVWAFEAFVPTTMRGLQKAFRANGWHRSEIDDRDVATWLATNRRSGSRGSYNMVLVRPESRSYGGQQTRTKLPDFAAHAYAKVSGLTPSLSCVTVFFVCTDEAQTSYSDALRRTYRSRIEPKGLAVSVVTPEWARRLAIEEIRREWRKQIADWLRVHFPGVTTANTRDDDLVTCELVVTEGFIPFDPVDRSECSTAEFLRIDWSPYVFDAKEVSNLSFCVLRSDYSNLPNHHILAAPKAELDRSEDAMDPVGGAFPYLYRLNDQFVRTFRDWSLLRLIDWYEERINIARETAVSTLDTRWPVSSIKKLRHLMGVLADVPALSRELSTLANEGGFSVQSGYRFNLRPWRQGKPEPWISEVVRDNVAKRAPLLSHADKELREFITAQGTLISAHSNYWLQVGAIVFAVASLVLGAVSALR